jgi:two-component system, cell cycle sensor histidine kinase and response regulator CckA
MDKVTTRNVDVAPKQNLALFAHSPIPHVLFDVTGRVLDLNHAAREFLGAMDVSVKEISFAERLDPYARARFSQHLSRVLRSGFRDEIDVTVAIDHTHHIVRVLSEPLHETDHQNQCVTVLLDETERVRAWAQRESRSERLRESRRLDSLGLLAAGIAHDFNNLLQVVTGCAEQVMHSRNLDECRGGAREILDTVDTAASVVHEILAFSRPQPLQATSADLNQLVGERMDMLRRIVGTKATLSFLPSPEPAKVMMDVEQFVRVLLNLVTNSRDAVHDGGSIMMVVRVSSDEQHVAELQVTDNGEGMDEGVRQRVFEPFFTTRQRMRGTGLGLAVVHGIVTRHGGTIDVRSARGVGTTFTLRFPIDARSHTAPSAFAETGSRNHRPRILAAGDEAGIRAVLRLTLEGAGYDTLVASDGEEAASQIADHGHTLDALVLDLNMPGRDGLAVYREARERFANIPVVFLSEYTNHVDLDKLKLTRVLAKPFAAQALLFHLGELLGLSEQTV